MAQREALRVRHNGPTGNGSPNRRLPGAGSGWRRSASATARGRRPIWTKGAGPTRREACAAPWPMATDQRSARRRPRTESIGRRRSRWMSPHFNSFTFERTSCAQILHPLDTPTETTSGAEKGAFLRSDASKRKGTSRLALNLDFGACRDGGTKQASVTRELRQEADPGQKVVLAIR